MKDNNEVQVEKESNENSEKTSNVCEVCWHFFLALILFTTLVFLFFFLKVGVNKVKLLANEKDIQRSYADDRKYRVVRLSNNMDVILIHDSAGRNSALSLTVGAGSFQDPDDAFGIAHLIEHLLFTSDIKPNEFEHFLAKNSGSSNSFTEEEKTTYYFELDTKSFEEGVSKFSKMLGNPLFNQEKVKSQIEVLKSEFEKTKNMDQWRERQLIKNLANPTHPFSRINIGDLEKLTKLDSAYISHLISTFYTRFYVPSSMKLVLTSSLDLSQMEYLANYYFSNYRLDSNPSGEKVTREITLTVSPYTSKELGKLVWYEKKPEYLDPTLDLIFVTSEILSKNMIEIKPAEYLNYLLKYSGEGSLIHILKKNNLAVKVEMGVLASFRSFSQYAITVTLTQNGLENSQKVIEMIFAYLNRIKNGGDKFINLDYFNEIKNISELKFKFLMKDDSDFENFSKTADYITSISNSMFEYDALDSIKNEYMIKTFNSQIIKEYVNSLSASNSLIILGSNKIPVSIKPEFETQNEKGETIITYTKDKYYHTKYTHTKLNAEKIEELSKTSDDSAVDYQFKFRPLINKFISQSKELISCYGESKTEDKSVLENFLSKIINNANENEICKFEEKEIKSKLMVNSQRVKMWYRQDRTFLAPRVDIYINIFSHSVRNDGEMFVYYAIFNQYLINFIDENLNEAVDAGNYINLDFGEDGITIRISAFTDVSDKILELIAKFLLDGSSIKEKFPQDKYLEIITLNEEYLKTKYNQSPYSKIKVLFTKIVENGVFTIKDLLDYKIKDNLNSYTYEEFIKTMESHINKGGFYINSLIYGSLDESKFEQLKLIFKTYVDLDSTNQNSDSISYSQLEEFKLIDDLHSHHLIDGSFIFKTALEEEVNSYIANFYQIGSRTGRDLILSDLIELILGNLFYYQIETVNKVGTVLKSEKMIEDNIIYLVFSVESSQFVSPEMLNKDIDQVISLLYERIEKMDDQKLQTYKDLLLSKYKVPYVNLHDKSTAAWNEVYQDSLDFEFKSNTIKELDEVKLEDLNNFFGRNFIGQPRKLSIRIYPKKIPSSLNSKEENYGILNNQLKSSIYLETDFLSTSQTLHKTITQ